MDVAVMDVTDGLEVETRRVPSNATSAAFEKLPANVPPEAMPSGVPRVSADIYEVPDVAVRVPTFNVGKVVEPFEASIWKELAEETALEPE